MPATTYLLATGLRLLNYLYIMVDAVVPYENLAAVINLFTDVVWKIPGSLRTPHVDTWHGKCKLGMTWGAKY